MRHAVGFALVSFIAITPVALRAQAAPPEPMFNVLTVYRETVKAGKGPSHDVHEGAWARANAAARNPTPSSPFPL
jgi:hypothetical protein